MNASIELAMQLKMKYLSGIVPVIDSNTKTSNLISHNVNLAYAYREDRQNQGIDSPKYFYTINLNPSTIKRDDFTDLKKF